MELYKHFDGLVNQKLCYFQIWKILENSAENVLNKGWIRGTLDPSFGAEIGGIGF